MAREFPPGITAIGESLESAAGQYLKSVRREVENLCRVCALPLHPDYGAYGLCYQCNRHRGTEHPLSDRVGSLIYAVEPDTQAYLTVRNYKAKQPGPSLVQRMRELLAIGLRGHTECLVKGSAAAISGWTVVASRTGRTALRDLVLELARYPEQEVTVSVRPDAAQRLLDPAAWTCDGDGHDLSHVLVIDDSWVSGSSVQSVASALKQAGADQVSVLTVARILRTSQKEIEKFVTQRLPTMDFDWRACPWTGTGVCP